MGDRLNFYIRRIRERLWIRPFSMSVLSIVVVFLAKMADTFEIGLHIPQVTQVSVETLLAIIASSMLVIATFAVASMVAAYTSASRTATPRTFSLIISDDISQNALSTFIGAFIFSIVALIALQNGYYDVAGRFVLFVITVLTLAMVIVTFVRWVDCIARLGRLTSTVDKVEAVTSKALRRRRGVPNLRGTPADGLQQPGQVVYGESVGYIKRIEIGALQVYAEKKGLQIQVAALPGTFASPGRALAYVAGDQGALADFDSASVAQAFVIGAHREFDEDPRFGLVVLSEIASRALSPAVNDPGTAIGIIGAFVRLFSLWVEPVDDDDRDDCTYDRVAVPEVSIHDMFDDAFTALARDGAATVEVAGRLQKAFASLACLEDEAMRKAVSTHSRRALARSELVLTLPDDLNEIRRLATIVLSVQPGQSC